jgi:hypothetical protein
LSPVYRKGPGGGYWYYWVPIVMAIVIVVIGLAAGVVELNY